MAGWTRRMVSAVIFDLDHTLFDPRQIPAGAFLPMIRALRSANREAGRRALSSDRLEAALEAFWLRSFDEVAREFAIPAEAKAACIAATRSVRISAPLQPYSDVHALQSLPIRRFLVTTGFRHIQESKVDALGIAGLFEKVYFDALDVPDARSDKEGIFHQVLRSTAITAGQMAVVGDNADSEIAAGNALGMLTIQIVRGHVRPSERAQYHIGNLWQLPDILGFSARRPAG